MSKKALIVLAEGFEEIEAVTVIDILRRAKIEVTIAGLHDTKVKAARGTVIMTDGILDLIKDEFDALILPGGMPGASNLASSGTVNDFVKAMYSTGKIVAAICAAPAVVLAPAGILKHKSATCFPGMEGQFSKDTTYKEDAVVVDANIITSRGPGTALKFALTIVEHLVGKEISEKIRQATLAD
ncbi:MAG: DJ-1/PfpI family protein [Candidatus Omnitrophica bacterium]|nr:DJ-1/PfpI family protein [Candidatus Omnitrophota bacterium]